MGAMCLHEHRDAGYSRLCDEPAGGAERLMRLDYYVCESEYGAVYTIAGEDAGLYAGAITYGVKITKTETVLSAGGTNPANPANPANYEESYIADVTGDIQKAKGLLRLLADNRVTPCCLRDVLEDICASWLAL